LRKTSLVYIVYKVALNTRQFKSIQSATQCTKIVKTQLSAAFVRKPGLERFFK